MKSQAPYTLLATVVVALGLGLLLGRCSAGERDGHAHAESGTESAEPTIWTCSMHPQIRQPEPGKCPICGMELIPLVDNASDDGPRTLSMSESSRALAEIQTTEVVREYPVAEVRMVGKLEYDETLVQSLTARFPARIDKLYVNYTGIPVKQGEHLAAVYSPELLTAQRELLSAYANNPDSSITDAARAKLELWDLLPGQIDSILASGQPKSEFDLLSPISGVVVTKNVKEGDYVKTGEPLFKIVNLDELWLFLDAYETDLALLRYGQEVNFTVEAYPGETFQGKIAFIEPEVNRKTRTVSVRVNVSNLERKLKPGMFARGIVEVKLAAGGDVFAPEFAGKWICPMHPEVVKDGPGTCDVCGMDLVPAEELGYTDKAEKTAPLVIPATAVLRTGKRAVAYVQKSDAERPTYEGREIVLGARVGDDFIVHEGLEEGELVVTNGAFKIDSALQIQAKPSMMSPPASDSAMGDMPGMDRGQMAPAKAEPLSITPELAAKLMPEYLKLQNALATDNLLAAKMATKVLLAEAQAASPLDADRTGRTRR